MIILDEIKEQLAVMLHPNSTIKIRDVGNSVGYYYKISVIPVILLLTFLTVLGMTAGPFSAGLAARYVGTSISIGTIVAGIDIELLIFIWVIVPIGLLISAVILQIIGGNLFKIFKGKYDGTISVLVYGAAIILLFSWLIFIPIIGGVLLALLIIWSLIVEIVGLVKVHKTSRLAVFGLMIGAVIIISLLIFLGAAIIRAGLY